MLSLLLTSEVNLIHSQRERQGAFDSTPETSLPTSGSQGVANPDPS
jgi:hypothetical protein